MICYKQSSYRVETGGENTSRTNREKVVGRCGRRRQQDGSTRMERTNSIPRNNSIKTKSGEPNFFFF